MKGIIRDVAEEMGIAGIGDEALRQCRAIANPTPSNGSRQPAMIVLIQRPTFVHLLPFRDRGNVAGLSRSEGTTRPNDTLFDVYR